MRDEKKLAPELRLPEFENDGEWEIKEFSNYVKLYRGSSPRPIQDFFVQVPLAQITWYHHISLLAKVKNDTERAFYIAETAKNEWSSAVMLLQIQSNFKFPQGLSQRTLRSVRIGPLFDQKTGMPGQFCRQLHEAQGAKREDPRGLKYAMRGLDKPLGVASYQLEALVKENIDAFTETTNGTINNTDEDAE